MNDERPVLGRRQLNKHDKRKRIARAARELFHEMGFEGTTTAQIARRAGVADGTLFLYVGRKEDLLILAFADEMVDVVRESAAAVDADASYVDQMLGFFDGLLAYHLSDKPLAKAFLREVGFLRDPQRDYALSEIPMVPSLRTIVERAKARSEIGDAFASSDVAMLAFSAYWYCLRDWANEEIDEQAFAVRLRLFLAMQLKGLAAS